VVDGRLQGVARSQFQLPLRQLGVRRRIGEEAVDAVKDVVEQARPDLLDVAVVIL